MTMESSLTVRVYLFCEFGHDQHSSNMVIFDRINIFIYSMNQIKCLMLLLNTSNCDDRNKCRKFHVNV